MSAENTAGGPTLDAMAERGAFITTAMERKLLTAIGQAFNGLSTSDLVKVYDQQAMTMPRRSFGRTTVEVGTILGDLLKRGLVVHRTLSAGWKLTDTGRSILEDQS